MYDIKFEWDQKKNRINISKHGISFEEATTVFADENAVIFDDPEHSLSEERFLIIGASRARKLFIVSHCYRNNDGVIRIISARNANKKESLFYKEFNNF